MTAMLERILSPENLDRAWRHLARDKADWSPGISRADMRPHQTRHLLQLRDDIFKGRYRPQGLRRFTVRKPDGGQRILSALNLRDKLPQKAVLLVLEPEIDPTFHPDSFGYRPRRNVQMANAKAAENIGCGLDWLVDADIRKFFDSIPHGQLIKLIRKRIPDKAVIRLMERWLAAGYASDSLFGERRGIPQGAIISPFLCNLYLDQFDRALDKHNIRFVRYADDFLLFTATRQQAIKAQAFADKQLSRLGLALHPEKTQIARSNPKLRFLGEPLPKPSR